jgi:putative Ca2+/H+ antiporter (TMEM165/GDT1 family)
MVEAFLVSTGLVALGEIGDKTQLLSLILSARFRRPWPIVAGIFAATLANHSMAGGLGAWITRIFGVDTMIKVAGASFLAMALWALVPDKLDESEVRSMSAGVFWTTVVMFFMAEMGDKTQLATVALAARYPSLIAVVAGTTLGMLIADVPVVFFGDAIAKKVPIAVARKVAAGAFAVLGAMALLG